MEAKDTVMDSSQMRIILMPTDGKLSTLEEMKLLLEKQAELSFKAGIEEALRQYAWWKEGTQYVGSCGTTLEKALTEYGVNLDTKGLMAKAQAASDRATEQAKMIGRLEVIDFINKRPGKFPDGQPIGDTVYLGLAWEAKLKEWGIR